MSSLTVGVVNDLAPAASSRQTKGPVTRRTAKVNRRQERSHGKGRDQHDHVSDRGDLKTRQGTVDPARMTAELAKKRVNSYSRWGDAAVVTDSVAGTSASRTTTTLYDDAGRTTSVQITSTGDGATQIPAVTSDYHPASGQVTATHAGTATITREYDLWGRLYRYTDADGGVTTNEFDRYGNPSKVTDPTGNATFGYDRV